MVTLRKDIKIMNSKHGEMRNTEVYTHTVKNSTKSVCLTVGQNMIKQTRLQTEDSPYWPNWFRVSCTCDIEFNMSICKSCQQQVCREIEFFEYQWNPLKCNVYVKRTRPNAVDRLGWTTYRATLRVDLLIHMFGFTSTYGYVGADATSSPSLYAGDGTPSSPTSAREGVHHSNVLSCSPL